MNAFSFLGLDKDHRKSNKVVHLVKKFSDCSKQLAKHFNDANIMYAQKKVDGVYAMAIITDVDVRIFGRTGSKLSSVNILEKQLGSWADASDFTGVLIFELHSYEGSLEEISGVVNPNRVKALTAEQEVIKSTLWMHLHDCITLEDFIRGGSSKVYSSRFKHLLCLAESMEGVRASVIPSVKMHKLDSCQAYADIQIFEQDMEGAVFKDPNGYWSAGSKNATMTKIVRGVDFDLEIQGVEEGKGKRKGMVANLLLRWKPYGDESSPYETISVDGRFTDEERVMYWNHPEYIVGKIAHVHALMLGSKGGLRLPKVRTIRIDKSEADL